MSPLLGQLARYVAQKAASDPAVREKAAKAARGAVDEAKKIAKEENKAYASGRSIGHAFGKLLNKQ